MGEAVEAVDLVLLVDGVVCTGGVFPFVGVVVQTAAVVHADVRIERNAAHIVFHRQFRAEHQLVLRTAWSLVILLGERHLLGISALIEVAVAVDAPAVRVVVGGHAGGVVCLILSPFVVFLAGAGAWNRVAGGAVVIELEGLLQRERPSFRRGVGGGEKCGSAVAVAPVGRRVFVAFPLCVAVEQAVVIIVVLGNLVETFFLCRFLPPHIFKAGTGFQAEFLVEGAIETVAQAGSEHPALGHAAVVLGAVLAVDVERKARCQFFLNA